MMISEKRKRKRKHKKKRSSLMGSNVDKEMDEIEENVERTSESESSGSDSSFDFCKDIDNVEGNVASAEHMKSESGSEGMSSDYDFCDVNEKGSSDESTKSPKAESSVVVSDIGCVDKGSNDESMKGSKVESSVVVYDISCVDKGSIDESMKSSKVESSDVVSDIGSVEKGSTDEFVKSSKQSLGTVSDNGGVEKDFIDETMKSYESKSSGAVSDISGVEKDVIDETMKSSKAESSGAVSDIGGVENGSIDESMNTPKAESTRLVSDIGGVDKGSSDESSMKRSTAELSGAVSDVGGVEKGSIDESMKSSKEKPSGAVSELESDNDVESQGSEDSEENMDIENYYDEQLEEVHYAGRQLQAPAYEQFCTNYQEFKAMHLTNIIREHALPYLPAKSLSRFRSVSKAWDIWIQSSFLAHQQSYKFRHLSGYFQERYTGIVSFTSLHRPSYGVPNPFVDFLPIPNRNVSVVSASNGLLLCKTTDGELTYFICNPATKIWKRLPQPRFYHGENPAVVLAFEPSVLNMEAHYELICAFPRLDEPVLSLEIYSSMTKEWRYIDSLCSELAKSTLKSNGFYFNGTAYWETESKEVLAFDLNIGIHGVLPLPSAVTAGGALGQMGGEVCYVCVRKSYNRVFVVSVYAGMGMDLKACVELNLGSRYCGGVPRSLDEDEDEEYGRVMPFFTDNTVTLLVDGCLYVCNLNEGRIVKTVSPNIQLHRDSKYWPYVNSLVRIA